MKFVHQLWPENMSNVTLTGWKPGLNKVELTKLMRSNAGLGLAEAKHMTDDLLEGNNVAVNFATNQEARHSLKRPVASGSCVL